MIADNLHKTFRKKWLNDALHQEKEILINCNKYYAVLDNRFDYSRFRDEIKRKLGLYIT